MKLHLLAIGKIRGSEAALVAEYQKRLLSPFTIRELATGTQEAECAALQKAIPAGAILVAMDERGKDLTSREMAAQLSAWQDQGARDLVFIIGGADGLTDALRQQASALWSLGRKTWPHMLARVLLVEQLYRAQQINAGHPYHRD